MLLCVSVCECVCARRVAWRYSSYNNNQKKRNISGRRSHKKRKRKKCVQNRMTEAEASTGFKEKELKRAEETKAYDAIGITTNQVSKWHG